MPEAKVAVETAQRASWRDRCQPRSSPPRAFSPPPASSPPGTAPPTRRSATWASSVPPAWTTPDDGIGARGRPLRLPHPRRRTRSRADQISTSCSVSLGTPTPRHQEGLPAARPPAAPRRQPRPGDAGAVQGGLARLRGAVRPAEAGGVRPRGRPVRRRRGGFGAGLLVHRHHGCLLRRRRDRRRRPGPWSASAHPSRSGRPDPAGGLAGGGGLRRHQGAQGRHRGRLHDVRRRRRGARHPVRSRARPVAAPARWPTCSAPSSARSARCVRARRAAASARSSPTRAASAPATAASARAAPSTSRSRPASTHGTRVQLTEQGEVGPGGGPPATSTSRSTSTPHPIFTRDGNDLHCTVTVPMTAAALGTTLTLPLLEADLEPAEDSEVRPTSTSRSGPAPSPAASRCSAGSVSPDCAAVAVTSSSPSWSTPRPDSTPRQEELLRELAAIRGEESPDRPGAVDAEVGLRPAARRLPAALADVAPRPPRRRRWTASPRDRRRGER